MNDVEKLMKEVSRALPGAEMTLDRPSKATAT